MMGRAVGEAARPRSMNRSFILAILKTAHSEPALPHHRDRPPEQSRCTRGDERNSLTNHHTPRGRLRRNISQPLAARCAKYDIAVGVWSGRPKSERRLL